MEDSGEGQEVNCMGNEMADRLDILMEILFKYIHEVTHMDGNFNRLLSCCNINILKLAWVCCIFDWRDVFLPLNLKAFKIYSTVSENKFGLISCLALRGVQ